MSDTIDTSSGNLIPGGGWYALVEGYAATDYDRGIIQAPSEDRSVLCYTPVIAWERYNDGDGKPAIRAWLSSAKPFASDRFSETCPTHFINHYVSEKPTDKREFFWA